MRPTRYAVSVLAIACAPATRPAPAPAGGSGATAPLGVEAPPRPIDVADWRQRTRINPRRFRSKGHGYLWVDVFVHPRHAATYGDRSAPAPEGFEVVMAGYENADGGTPTGLTVMAKMPPGYDAVNADWYYAIYDADGQTPTIGGKLAPCNGCHVHARARDFLFGVTAKEEAP